MLIKTGYPNFLHSYDFFVFPLDFLACKSSDDAPVIVFVSKMFAVEDSALPKHRKRYSFFLPTRDSSKAAIVKLIAT